MCRDGYSIQRIVHAAALQCYVSFANKSFAFYILKALSPSEGVAKGYACMQCGLQGDFIITLPEAGAASDRLLTA